MPEPTPVDGIDCRPRDETPSEVIVTTESRTAATTSVRAGSLAVAVERPDPVAVVTAAGACAAFVPDPVEPASGPVTRAAVPPAARTADSSEAARTDANRPPRRGVPTAGPSPGWPGREHRLEQHWRALGGRSRLLLLRRVRRLRRTVVEEHRLLWGCGLVEVEHRILRNVTWGRLDCDLCPVHRASVRTP